ncbi:LysR family transcriptional regulator [Acidaminococcus intestini]|nr:LysR family transcriptional regulator [Acidaminococcus intestini]
MSDRLKRLEAEFGCQLFIRQPRGILFTSQGRCWSNTSTKRMNAIKKSAAPLQNPWEKPLVPFPSPAPTYLPSTTCQAF